MQISNVRTYLVALCLLVGIRVSHAQQYSLTISAGAKWNDVALMTSQKASESDFASRNFSTYPRISATAWTHSGGVILYRTLLKVNVKDIPANSSVVSATLYLYSDPGGASETGNAPTDGSNAIFVERVTRAWDSTKVSWNTIPTTTTAGRIAVGQSTSNTENLQINMTSMVQDMVNNPAANYGVLISLQNEVYYRSRNYASAEHTNTALRPKLIISYVPSMFFCIKDGNWSDPIWSPQRDATVGTTLPYDAVANVSGRTITVKTSASIRRIIVSSANGIPGKLMIDGCQLTGNQVDVTTDHAGNQIKVLDKGQLYVTHID